MRSRMTCRLFGCPREAATGFDRCAQHEREELLRLARVQARRELARAACPKCTKGAA